MFWIGFFTGVLVTVGIAGFLYMGYKSERKDGLLAEHLETEFKEGIFLGKKKGKK